MSAKDVVSVEAAWEKVVVKFREVCVLRREFKLAESERVLKEEMPRVIAAWSAVNPEPIAAKKAELETMFATERKYVDQTLVMQRLLAGQMSEQLLPAMREQVAAEVKKFFAEQMRGMQATMMPAENKGAARAVAAMMPEAAPELVAASPVIVPMPMPIQMPATTMASMAGARRPNFTLARAS